MQPVARQSHIDTWIIVQQLPTGTFSLYSMNTSEYGPGYFKTLEQAQHVQTLELLKGNRVEIFHLEYPIK